MFLEARVGEVAPVEGTQDAKMDRLGGMRFSALMPRFYALAASGRLFIASTAVGGVAPGTALGTTPPMAIWNPPNSGLNVAVVAVSLGYVSGTLGAGFLAYAQEIEQNTIPTTGTELTPVSALLNSAIRGKARAFEGSTLRGTPTIVRPSGIILNASLATTATNPVAIKDEVDGEIVMPPGGAFVVQGVAAGGSTPLVVIGVCYAELPL